MSVIDLSTIIKAPVQRCFDLARSIDMHVLSVDITKERAIAGITSGLINKGETVTWEAIHFGIKQRMTVEITEMNEPYFFSDRMLKGAFRSMYHEHYFSEQDEYTIMKDHFSYETPYGFAGRLFDVLILKKYMTRFLTMRNRAIKNVAETDAWKAVLK